MEGATDLEERSKLEANVFACIMPAIDATRRVYERRHGFTSEENNLKSNLAMLLSGLGLIKLIWPLPKEAFDAEILLLMTHIFEDLEGTSNHYITRARAIPSLSGLSDMSVWHFMLLLMWQQCK
jgi:hypothetical protein